LFNPLKGSESSGKYIRFCVEDESVPSTNLESDFAERKCLECEIQHEEYPLFEWNEDPHLVSKNHSKRRFPRSPLSWKGNTNEGIGVLQTVEKEIEVLPLCDVTLETKWIVSKRPNSRVYLEEH
jgi:hypothetical protein